MKFKAILVGLLVAVGISILPASQTHAAAIPDISEWQGNLTYSKVKRMKRQVSFVIQRRQYGSGYIDKYAAHNTDLYNKAGVKFGEYDFATFKTVAQAKREAYLFYKRSDKHALFYVLDFEAVYGSRSSRATNRMVAAWYNQMRRLTKKKLIFYSYSSFATTYANTARKKFNAQWIASYGSRPTIPFALWQYTDSYYLSSLGLRLDNSRINSKVHSLGWWLGKKTATKKKVKLADASWQAGQTVKLNQRATNYYDRRRIAKNAKNKNYLIVSTKTIKQRSRSKQAVLLAGLNRWVLCQDIGTTSGKVATKYRPSAFDGVKYWLTAKASRYYGGGKIAKQAKQKLYYATAVKNVASSHSRQALYLPSLKRWVLAQDVVGYVPANARFYVAKTRLHGFTSRYLTNLNGKSFAKNARLVASGQTLANHIVRLKTSRGYVSADSRLVEPRYFQGTGTAHYLTLNARKTVYAYRNNSFKSAAAAEKLRANVRYSILRLVRANNGSCYFELTNHTYVTADRLQVTLH